MHIRKTTPGDLAAVMKIYHTAQVFMKENGNPAQWGTFYPTDELIKEDIRQGISYVCTENDTPAAVFVFKTGADETYARIYNGAWLNDKPYGVIHRIASAHTVKGAAVVCIQWAFSQCGNIRIDTHRDNVPVQQLLTKLGFTKCGIIHTFDGTDRLAFQKTHRDPLASYLPSGDDRLDAQLRFIAEIDRMTRVLRRTLHIDGSGRENDAEHSWHLAMMVLLLGEYEVDTPDTNRALRMVLVHDLIEIYAGDTFAYDKAGNATKAVREKQAADKLFSQLPDDQGPELRALWEEFDAMETADSRFAACMDRLQPFLHNTLTDGATWVEGKVHRDDVLARMDLVRKNMPRIWPWVLKNSENAVSKGWLLP